MAADRRRACGDSPPDEIAPWLGAGNSVRGSLLEASGCPEATATFWATNEDGDFVTFIPGAAVEVVNAAWRDLFGSAIPYYTALLGRCK